jgi:TPP-dependent pyruvate/acetoin dehydrogenase alpha subunit
MQIGDTQFGKKMPSDQILKRLYFKMLRIRRVEEAIAQAYPKQEMRCPVHLSIGQEAVPVGICDQLGVKDRVYSTHRCHAHYLAKDGGINEMLAELYGKSTGCCKGKGGSMHLVQRATGMMGSSALVAGTIPLAVGSALAALHDKSRFVTVAFFGDGATEEGIFYESMNFAALKKLPIIFACENNLYATYSHQSARQATTNIANRALAFGMPSAQIDGNDVKEVYRSATESIERARSGGGPTLIEFKTYRWRDHVGPNLDHEVGYRTKQEVDEWIARCPIARLEKELVSSKILSPNEKEGMEKDLASAIETGFAFAKKSPFPMASEIYSDIYA